MNDTVCERWKELFGEAVDGPNTVECDMCGTMVLGDSPAIVVTCLLCFRAQEERS